MVALTNSNNELSLGGLIELTRNIEDSTSMSLFQYTKRSTINSRVFIEKNLAGEEILTPLMMNIMNLYTGLIFTAMNMNRYVHGSKKVRDAMSVVATESFAEPNVSTDSKMAKFFGNSTMFGLRNSDGTDFGTDYRDADDAIGQGTRKNSQVTTAEPKDANLPSGRIIQIAMGAAGEAGAKSNGDLIINLYLQLLPSFIPSDVAEQFVALNFTPTIRQRWMQASAGEISFFKDVVMGQDIRKKRMKALKNDKSGALKEMIERQENSLANSWLKLTFVTPERQNIANTILIFNKNTFDKACSSAGLNFKNYNSRQKFFNKTFAMMLCTIDPLYNKIDMYYHGLQAVSTFTFEQMKRNAKTEAVDLMSIMKTYASGMAPKF